MGLPSLVINRDELPAILKKILSEVSMKVSLENAKVEGLELDLGEEEIETLIDVIVEKTDAKSITVQDIYMAVINVQTNMSVLQSSYSNALTDASFNLTSLLNEQKAVETLLQRIIDYLSIKGIPYSIPLRQVIPGSEGDFYLTFSSIRECLLTSVFSFQSEYRFEDSWSLYVNNELLFDHVGTKYTEERKNFSSHYGIKSGDTIRIVFHNYSGKTKTINYDIDFLV
jgi:hypothetical protein